MEKIFIDTAVWLALLNKSDQYHEIAKQTLTALQADKSRFITSEFVLLEVADALAHPNFRGHIRPFIKQLHKRIYLEVVPLDNNILNDAWDLFEARPDKNWGITDCTSFVIMSQQNINTAFTTDQHFSQAGYQKLL